MYITHSYLGVTQQGFKCLFLLLVKDYIDEETAFFRSLEPYLQRFARNLGDAGSLVRPFKGDIETTQSDVLDKRWAAEEKKQIIRTPGLLMIDQDFDIFDPREHPWVHIYFGTGLHRTTNQEIMDSVSTLGGMLADLADALQRSDVDLFGLAEQMQSVVTAGDVAKLFEAKPGVFGFSIDLKEGYTLAKHLLQRLRGEH